MNQKNKLSELLLLSGNDIPFPEAQITFHPPTLKEIAYIGETAFFMGVGFLNFSKKMVNSMDKTRLEKYDDFDIFIAMMIEKGDPSVEGIVNNAFLVLNLIFPLYEVEVRNDRLVLKKDKEEHYITKKNFPGFKQILSEVFSLNLTDGKNEYNPKGELSQRIADKLKQRHAQLAKLKHTDLDISEKNVNILSRYCSILSVGTQKTLIDLMQYTVYQLYDEFQRFQLKVQWDAYIQAKIAGAQNLDEVDNWMIDLKTSSKIKNKNY